MATLKQRTLPHTEEQLTFFPEGFHAKTSPMQSPGHHKASSVKTELGGGRSGLWFEYERAIKEIQPKFVVAENVKALTKQGLDIVLQSLTDIGYDAEWICMPASAFGAPHLRQRIWIVAYPFGLGREQESVIFREEFSQAIRHASEWESSRAVCQENGKKTLPESFGIHDGVPRELYDGERMKGLGNAVVPQIPYQIFKAIDKELNA